MGICLHRAGAASVLLTDGDGQTLCNCRCNLDENGVSLTEQACVNSWSLPAKGKGG